jgi:hypothetical protein
MEKSMETPSPFARRARAKVMGILTLRPGRGYQGESAD